MKQLRARGNTPKTRQTPANGFFLRDLRSRTEKAFQEIAREQCVVLKSVFFGRLGS